MNYPTLTEIQSTRQMVDVFGGYNHNLRINDGEFYDTKNLTSSYYPVLSPRAKRGTYISVSNPLGMIAKDSLCYVDGDSFYINQYKIDGLILDPDTPKTLVSMGAYVVIFPDRKWVNTAKFNGTSFNPYADDNETIDGYGGIDAYYETAGDGGVYTWTKFTLCKADGSSYEDSYKGDSEPKYTEEVTDDEGNTKTVKASPPNGQLWLDTSSTPHSLKMYSASSGMWVSIATTYIKIESAGIDKNFEVFDGIEISGLGEDYVLNDYLAQDEQGNYAEIAGHTREQLADLEGSAVVWEKGENYIVVVGILDEEKTINNKIEITRKAPDMDFVIENQNRLWGCKYGIVDGETVNEIYVSKQGDFKNWNCFMGLSTDSYAASCGTDGEFTGAVTHMGYPLFLKEGFMHKVYGNYPANFQIQTTACRGVQKGCHNSLAIVNEVLYYKSRSGVMAYDGSLPTEVSYALGEESYDSAVACGHGNKYYISMRDTIGDYNLFVYDTKKGIWHKEDNTQVDMFCSCRGELYYKPHGESIIKTMLGSGVQDTAPVEWMAETGVMSVSSPDKKYISRINVRMSLDIGTRVYFYIQYDSMGEWEHISSMAGTVLRTFTVPIRPKRCDHMRLRIVGEGDAKIYSITKTIEQGSDT